MQNEEDKYRYHNRILGVYTGKTTTGQFTITQLIFRQHNDLNLPRHTVRAKPGYYSSALLLTNESFANSEPLKIFARLIFCDLLYSAK